MSYVKPLQYTAVAAALLIGGAGTALAVPNVDASKAPGIHNYTSRGGGVQNPVYYRSGWLYHRGAWLPGRTPYNWRAQRERGPWCAWHPYACGF